MKAFLTRNMWELAQVVVCAAGASVTLWIAAMLPISWLEQFWYGGCWVVFAACTGYWIWAIFDNAEQDRLEREVDTLFNALEHTEDPYLAGEVRRTLNGEVSE